LSASVCQHCRVRLAFEQLAISWEPFSALSATELYELMELRQRVFVVEQNCVYLDADGHDPSCIHGVARRGGRIVACARIVPPGITYDAVSIGRVAIDRSVRGHGFGHDLIRSALDECDARFPREPITIGAQLYLQVFYEGHGFVAIGQPYVEDGIEHVDMHRSAATDRIG
jgi:ElaA protein